MKSKAAAWRAMAAVVVAAMAVVPVIAAEGPPAKAVDLAAAKAMAAKYARYAHTDAKGTWETSEEIATAKEADAKAWVAEGGTVSVDADGLKLVSDGQGCNATLAKKTFKGPIGIRYEAKTAEGANPCDLSVRFGPASSPATVSFAFGGYNNTENFFYIGKTRKVIGSDPLITVGQWYTVEVLLEADKVIAKIDGKVVGEEKLAVANGPETEHDVTLYVWASTGVFRKIQLLKYVPPKREGKNWEEVMGKTTEAELKALAAQVGPMLGDEKFAAREAAFEILLALRPLSNDVVREQLQSKNDEVRQRAEKLATSMGLIATSKPAPVVRPGRIRVVPQGELE